MRTAAILIVAAVALVFAAPATASVRRAGHGVGRVAAWSALSRGREASRVASLSRGGVFGTRFGSGSALVGSAPVGNGPGADALNEATDTLYVANGENDNGPNATGNTVSVIDTRRCDARDVSRCKGPWPTITVGNLPSGIAIDERTDTVYVANLGDNTVSVFKGATCNGQNTAGCGQTPVTVPVGLDPLGLFADPANHTVYVPNFGGPAVNQPPDSTTVSMLDSATCNASHLAGCPATAPPTVDVGASPDDVDVDRATHTAYVTTIGALNGWSVFDANTCNATVQSGCGSIGFLTGDPAGPNAAQVDTANHTLYTANFDNTVSAFDLHHCNAGDLSGCANDVPGTVTVPGPSISLWLVVDARLHSVYVVYQKDDVLAVINTDVCRGSDPAGCATLSPPEIHTGADPQMVRLDPHTQTLYTPNEVDSDVSVIDPRRCDAQTTRGCRARAPEVPIGTVGALIAADPAVNTVYDPSAPNTVSMINTHQCNALHSRGCSQTPPTMTVGAFPSAVAVDPATHTVYVANFPVFGSPTGSVSVFDDRTCNATDQAGCGAVSTLQVPGGLPNDIAVNPATDTVYVATIAGSGPNLISVFNGATCNASDALGCGQTPATIKFGDSGPVFSNDFVAVDAPTNTVYATNVVFPPSNAPFVGDSVYVINGAHCDASDMSGCGQTPAIVTLSPVPSNPFGIPGQQPNPWGLAVDEATDTIYTANLADGEGPGTVSVINGATCNGQDTTGCGQTPATAPAGFGTVNVAVDQLTNRIYATNLQDSSITKINGDICNGTNTDGCGHTRTNAFVGHSPGAIAVDPSLDTAYVADGGGVSVISLGNH